MQTSRLLTTAVAALTVVGAGLVYAQTTTTPPGPGTTTQDQATPGQPASPGTTTAPGMGAATPTTPSQDTTQRSNTMPMAPDAQADRN